MDFFLFFFGIFLFFWLWAFGFLAFGFLVFWLLASVGFWLVIDQVLACHQMSIYEAWFSLFGPVTGTEQIAVAVLALSDLFPTGLLILHDPAQGAYLFQAGLPATFLSFRETFRWHGTFTGTPVMLFTHSHRAVLVAIFNIVRQPPLPRLFLPLSGHLDFIGL